ncbi:phage gp6-like head-tail connector protein (plasmid) [Sarcina sp. JB2]|uniref:Phage gp6-like head-tail connector protein n=1 Tax=Candidatus Sarcina troglodytae TaxID=2726954 RepID=A0ACD1BGM2_9CLOT|nr:head-tail connector protein [Sarcina sp. JB2]QPJ86725.1 phage gp6-like head-tail connector protein [Sarcina sp. JB2]
MKFSEVDLDFVKEYLRIEQDWTEDDTELELFIQAGKAYIYEISNADDDYLDTQDFAVVVLMMLINDWYTNKGVNLNGSNLKVNPLFDRMLDRLRGYKL